MKTYFTLEGLNFHISRLNLFMKWKPTWQNVWKEGKWKKVRWREGKILVIGKIRKHTRKIYGFITLCSLCKKKVTFLADTSLVGSALDLHLCVCRCVSVSIVNSWLKCLISLVLDYISFWNLLETFLGCLYTSCKKFWISCTSVSLLVDLDPYWN